MSSRYRSSTARFTPGRESVAPAPSSSRSHPFTKELPPYRKPSHQLNPQAQAKLRAIYSNSTSNSIATQNKVVVELIRTAAGAINDQLRDRTERVERRRKKWDQGQHVEEQEEEETELAALQEKVNEMTKKLEESMRGVIDAGEAAKRVEECLAWVRENSARTQVQEYETQMSQRQSASQSQAPSQRRRGEDEDEDEEDEYENEGPTPGPTPLTQARVALTGPSEMFTSRLQRQKQEYLTISHQTRYSKHNSYIGFKSMVHDAQYGDSESAPPLPHPDTWFTERGSPAPGITATQGGEDDDDDIVVDRATVSTRCPITYQIFKEPYSSKKCPHSFEKTAILEMIRRSRTRSIECPVPGCQQNLSKDDLHENFLLIRKINRMQLAEQRAGEDSDEDDDEPAPRKRQKQEHGDENKNKIRSTIKSEVFDLGSPSGEDDE